jgi:glycosyltransferase involved in cell wall biosynthesis
MMESLAMGLPVVSTRVSGIPELVRDGENGLLVSEKDAAALAAALGQLMEDDALRRQLAARGRELVEREFNIRENARRMVDLFQQVIREHGTST